MGKGGKATGRYKNWLNIRDVGTDLERCIDWQKEIKEWNECTSNVMLASVKDYGYEEAKRVELDNWEKMGVYEVVEDRGQSFVTVRWVLSQKLIDNERKNKARLVARGYEDDTYGIAKDSPTVNKENLRLAFMIIASKKWVINSLDIRAAFLQGKPISREVYLKPPREANMKGKLWKLQKCVYGLNDASRNFYLKVKEELLKLGCKCCQLDQALFYYHKDGLQGLFLSHVDDFLWAGSGTFKANVIDKIKSNFKISSENSSVFKYLGVEIQQCQQGIYISQNKYAGEIEMIKVDPKRINVPLDKEEKSSLRSAIGQLNWLVLMTRPDIAYDVCEISSNLNCGTTSLLNRTNRLIKKIKYQPVCLLFPVMDLNDLSINCYGDASLGNLSNGGSQGGTFVEMVSGYDSCPIDWKSRRIRRVATSTLTAETLAIVDAIESANYTRSIAEEILYGNTKRIKVTCYTDNLSLFQTAKTSTQVTDKRLRMELSVVREAVSRGDIELKWVESREQLADCLTKKGNNSTKLLERINAM